MKIFINHGEEVKKSVESVLKLFFNRDEGVDSKNVSIQTIYDVESTMAQKAHCTQFFLTTHFKILLRTSRFYYALQDFSTHFKILLRTSIFLLRTSIFLLRTSSFLLRTSRFLLRTSNFLLRTSTFLLRTSSFLLRTSSFLIRTSSYILKPYSRIEVCISPVLDWSAFCPS